MAVKKKVKMIVEIDEDVQKEFKKLCIDSGTNMSSTIRKCIRSWVNEQKKNIVY